MKITEIKFRHFFNKEDSRAKAILSVVLDDELRIHDIRVIEGTKGLFVAMPSKKTNFDEHFDYVHPIKQEVRDMFEKEIIEAYKKALEEKKDEVEE